MLCRITLEEAVLGSFPRVSMPVGARHCNQQPQGTLHTFSVFDQATELPLFVVFIRIQMGLTPSPPLGVYRFPLITHTHTLTYTHS